MTTPAYPELRFASLEQYEQFCKTRSILDSVMPFIKDGDEIKVNPEYTNAPYCERFVFMDRRKFVLEEPTK